MQYSFVTYCIASKSLSSAEWHFSIMKCKALEILHGLEKYCFMREVCIIYCHKPLVAILSKMWQHCNSGNNTCYYEYTSTECASYISLIKVIHHRLLSCSDYEENKTRKLRELGKHECHQYINKCASMHIHTRYTDSYTFKN